MSAWTDRGDSTPIGNPVDRDFIGAITMVMAGSLLVFLRCNIGARLMIRSRFVATGVLLFGFSCIETPFDQWLTKFAVAVVVLVFIHHARHVRRIRAGAPGWHTYDTGKSLLFHFVPLPVPLVQGVIEPLLCGYCGWWLSQQSLTTFYLGWWITLSAGMLFFLENTIRVARREKLFDLGDTFVESLHFARIAERFTDQSTGGGGAPRQQRHNGLWDFFALRINKATEFAGQGFHKWGKAVERQLKKRRGLEKEQAVAGEAAVETMTVADAIETLELIPGATAQEIRVAYNHLIQHVHPDMDGSHCIAKRLSVARDVLLKPRPH